MKNTQIYLLLFGMEFWAMTLSAQHLVIEKDSIRKEVIEINTLLKCHYISPDNGREIVQCVRFCGAEADSIVLCRDNSPINLAISNLKAVCVMRQTHPSNDVVLGAAYFAGAVLVTRQVFPQSWTLGEKLQVVSELL